MTESFGAAMLFQCAFDEIVFFHIGGVLSFYRESICVGPFIWQQRFAVFLFIRSMKKIFQLNKGERFFLLSVLPFYLRYG
jgi:hypothetical protein